MTQEYKELLLKDLCSRVSYHPKGHVVNACTGAACDEWLTCATFSMFTSIKNNCRLYLRPMSSMTEEEKKEMHEKLSPKGTAIYKEEGISTPISHYDNWIPYEYMSRIIDWLNAHHFDYRGLIEKGLAIEVTEEIILIKNKII